MIELAFQLFPIEYQFFRKKYASILIRYLLMISD